MKALHQRAVLIVGIWTLSLVEESRPKREGRSLFDLHTYDFSILVIQACKVDCFATKVNI